MNEIIELFLNGGQKNTWIPSWYQLGIVENGNNVNYCFELQGVTEYKPEHGLDCCVKTDLVLWTKTVDGKEIYNAFDESYEEINFSLDDFKKIMCQNPEIVIGVYLENSKNNAAELPRTGSGSIICENMRYQIEFSLEKDC